MLARIAHELYWIGRQLARAEHTSRMLDGVFHADLQGQPDDPAGVRLSWAALVTIGARVWPVPRGGPAEPPRPRWPVLAPPPPPPGAPAGLPKPPPPRRGGRAH